MGRRQGTRRARILKQYVTDGVRSRRPIFIATLRVAASWLFLLRRGGSLRVKSRYARRPRLEKSAAGSLAFKFAVRCAMAAWDTAVQNAETE
jgi:hypothetical protein